MKRPNRSPAFILLLLALAAASSAALAQSVRDDFNRAQASDLAGSEKWHRLRGLTDTAATFQLNADSTISPFHPLGALNRGGVYWDSTLSGRFQVGIILKHKSGSDNIPTFHLQLMSDTSWLTGAGYGLRFQENAGTDRYDIQRITGSGADTPFVALLATSSVEVSAGDTLFFRFYENGRKTAARYGAGGVRDSISIVDTVYNPAGWRPWIQGRVFPDSFKLDDFMLGPIPYTIAAGAGAGGSISPAGPVLVDPGADQTFTITPDAGYAVVDVLVDSASIGAAADYTFSGVAADHTILALFDTLAYTVTATAGAHGAISPEGAVGAIAGQDLAFTILPDTGCHLDSLLVDGLPVDSTTSYTFNDVATDHTITAFFSLNVYSITATAGPNGSIFPAGNVPVVHGSNQAFTMTPDPGYFIDTLTIDGSPADTAALYTFTDVTGPHTIGVTFTRGEPATRRYPVVERWNIVSVPLDAADRSTGVLFPTASGPAYAYGGGYSTTDTLTPGRGYWIRFPAADSVTITGHPLFADTVGVDEGWNMVGAISNPLPVSNVATIPAGLTASGFFGYAGGYAPAQTLQPGQGYWVKMSAPGMLVLSELASVNHLSALRIVPTGELPPAPPGGQADDATPGIPAAFALAQNYPNPFNPTTTIGYDLPEDSPVRLSVFNVLGEEVARLVDGTEPAGRRSVRFEAAGLPAGIYLCRLKAGEFTAQVKMLFLK